MRAVNTGRKALLMEETTQFVVRLKLDGDFGLGIKLGSKIASDSSDKPKPVVYVDGFKRNPVTNQMLPAEAVGVIQLGDQLVAVNEEPIEGKDVNGAISVIRNAVAKNRESPVVLHLQRRMSPKPMMPSGSTHSLNDSFERSTRIQAPITNDLTCTDCLLLQQSDVTKYLNQRWSILDQSREMMLRKQTRRFPSALAKGRLPIGQSLSERSKVLPCWHPIYLSNAWLKHFLNTSSSSSKEPVPPSVSSRLHLLRVAMEQSHTASPYRIAMLPTDLLSETSSPDNSRETNELTAALSAVLGHHIDVEMERSRLPCGEVFLPHEIALLCSFWRKTGGSETMETSDSLPRRLFQHLADMGNHVFECIFGPLRARYNIPYAPLPVTAAAYAFALEKSEQEELVRKLYGTRPGADADGGNPSAGKTRPLRCVCE